MLKNIWLSINFFERKLFGNSSFQRHFAGFSQNSCRSIAKLSSNFSYTQKMSTSWNSLDFCLWDPWKYQQYFSVNKYFTFISLLIWMGDREMDKGTKEIHFLCFCQKCLGSLTYEQSRDSHSNLSGYLLLRSTKHAPRKRTFAPHM